MQRHEGTFRTGDGLALFRQAWTPDGQPRAICLIVHGFGEHSGRHVWHAERLANRGYAVHAFDLRGHGRSSGSRVYVHRFDQYVDDLALFCAQVRSEMPGRPLFVFGHSMGGEIAAFWAIDRQPEVTGIALSAPALSVASNVFPLLRRFAEPIARWLPRLRLVRFGCRNLSRDPSVVDAFRSDPLAFHGRFPVRTGAEILRVGPWVLDRAEAISVPLLVLQGTGDRVVDPRGADDLVRRAGSPDKTLQRYDGLFHEVLSEPEREQVFADLAGWLDARC